MKNLLKPALSLFFVASIYTSVNAQSVAINSEKSDIFELVEEMPMINRCAVRVMTEEEKKECTSKEMMSIIAENIKYPAQAKKENISGTVYVAFVVDEFGNVINVEVVRGTNASLDKEAVKAVKATNGHWIAGKQDGKNVKVKYTVPIKFSL